MQTIGKTNNKMDFPLNWTDILLESISGKTNYTIDVKIGTKRISTDNQDQRDITKKRRKQSNPTRISSTEDNKNYGIDTKLISSEDKNNKLNHIEPTIDIKVTPHQQSLSSVPLNLIKSENQNTLSSDERQKIPLPNNNEQQNESPTEVEENVILSHQPLSHTNVYVEKKDNYLSEYSACISSFKIQPNTSVTNIGQSSVQIFNPEAFCDQCNKEFCNKYFLKTHKANKHGVYFDTNSNSSILDQVDKSKMSSLLVTSDYSNCTNDISIGRSTSTISKNPIMFSQSFLNTNASMLKNVFNNHTRAFCNICQKEFCNKYFVRRHKAKIHGIIDDGDYRLTIDDMPLNYKTNLQIKNEDSDNEVSGTFDKDEKTVSPSFDDTHRPMSEISKNGETFIKDIKISDNNELVMKSVIVETPCDYIKTEHSNIEKNLKCVNKLLLNGIDNTNDCGNNSELSISNYSTHMTSTNYERVIYPNEFSKSNIENMIIQRSTELRSNISTTPINLITNNGEHVLNDVLINANCMEKPTENELNSTRLDNASAIIETDKFTKIDDVQIELINKSKLFKCNDLLIKLNDDAPKSTLKSHVRNGQVDGSLETHISDKHENISRELLTNGSVEPVCNEGSLVRHSCFGCHLTFDSDASLKAHSELSVECNVKGGASTSSKNSAENDECAKSIREFSGERRSSAMMSSFCKICNKELCNKYFMKTHMQRMHGISIENGNHIGGVVCDVCNKELCSKYFLRVHKQNSHGIVETGAGGINQKFWQDPAAESNGHPHSRLSDELDVNGHRYYKHYTEVCSICFRRFRSSKWLDAHLLNDHGDEGRAQWKYVQHNGGRAEDDGTVRREQVVRVDCEIEAAPVMDDDVERIDGPAACEQMKQYRCSYCPFSTSILSFLFVHEKFHVTGNNTSADHASEDSSADTITNGQDVFANELEPPPLPPLPPPPSDEQRETENTPTTLPSGKDHHEPFIMQSFFLENCSVSPSVKATGSSGRSDSFHSSLVYLPVKEKLTSTVNVFFKLTPT